MDAVISHLRITARGLEVAALLFALSYAWDFINQEPWTFTQLGFMAFLFSFFVWWGLAWYLGDLGEILGINL